MNYNQSLRSTAASMNTYSQEIEEEISNVLYGSNSNAPKQSTIHNTGEFNIQSSQTQLGKNRIEQTGVNTQKQHKRSLTETLYFSFANSQLNLQEMQQKNDKKIESESMNPRKRNCRMHPESHYLGLLCTTCEIEVCNKCIAHQKHNGHNIQDISGVNNIINASFTAQNQRLLNTDKSLEKEIQKLIQDKKKSIRSFENTFKKLVDVANQKCNDIGSFFDQKIKLLRFRRKEIDQKLLSNKRKLSYFILTDGNEGHLELFYRIRALKREMNQQVQQEQQDNLVCDAAKIESDIENIILMLTKMKVGYRRSQKQSIKGGLIEPKNKYEFPLQKSSSPMNISDKEEASPATQIKKIPKYFKSKEKEEK